MSKLSFLVMGLIAALSFSSCVSTNKGFQSSPVISRNVQLDPIKADIVVNEKSKLSGESSSTYFLIFRIKGDKTYADGISYSTDVSASIASKLNVFRAIRLNKVRSSAAYDALSKGDYDFLVHPNYTMTTKSYLGIVRTYKVGVTGYGANYKNFRTEKQKIVIVGDGDKEYILSDNK